MKYCYDEKAIKTYGYLLIGLENWQHVMSHIIINNKNFLQFYKEDLIYKKESLVNWDPVENTVLANEQVIDGKAGALELMLSKRNYHSGFLNNKIC